MKVSKILGFVIFGVFLMSLKYFWASGPIAPWSSKVKGRRVIFWVFISLIIDSPLMSLLCCLFFVSFFVSMYGPLLYFFASYFRCRSMKLFKLWL